MSWWFSVVSGKVTDPIEIIDTGTCREIYDETRGLFLFTLVFDQTRQLHCFLGRCTADIKILQAGRRRLIVLAGVTETNQNTYFAGIRRSSINSPSCVPPVKPFALTLLDCTLTTMRAGFRNPTRTSSEIASASVMVALNKPVRRCFGRCVRMRVRTWLKPRSSNLRVAIVSARCGTK